MATIITTHSHSTTSQASPGALGTEHHVRTALVGMAQSDHGVRNQGGHIGDVHMGMGGQEWRR